MNRGNVGYFDGLFDVSENWKFGKVVSNFEEKKNVEMSILPQTNTFFLDRRCSQKKKMRFSQLLVNLIYCTGLYLATIAGFQCIYVYIKKEFVF